MANVTVSQLATSQGNFVASQYINKVSIAADGTMTVTKERLVPTNVAAPLPTTTTKLSTANQIVANTKTTTVISTASPVAVNTDSDGVVTNPQPPGPPLNALGN